MKKLNKRIKIISILMFSLLILAFILIRINNNISKIISIVLIFISIILGLIINRIDKKL